MGVHGKGIHNENDQALVDWLLQRQLFLCNTAFQHPPPVSHVHLSKMEKL